MVKIKEPIVGGFCRKIVVDGFSDYANPERVRLCLYNFQMGMPERDESEAVLQLVRETELVMDRELFYRFADRVAAIRDWLEKHRIQNKKMTKEEVRKYVHEHFTSEEILAIWAGGEVSVPDNIPLGLLPLYSDENE